jgi:hypothetical protein
MVFMLEVTSLMGLCYDGEVRLGVSMGGEQLFCLAMACVKFMQNSYVSNVFFLQIFLRNLFSRRRLV